MARVPTARRKTRVRTSHVAPLTEAQEGLWHAQRLDPANPIFNTGQFVDIRGTVDVEAFRQAVNAALDEADALAVRIVESSHGPGQIEDEFSRARLEIVDLTSTAEPVRRARQVMRRDLQTPLDLGRDPLARTVLFMLPRERYFWYHRVHHMASDGYGTALLTARICDLYKARVEGRILGGGGLGSFARVLADDTIYRSSARRERDRGFWLATFADRPAIVGLAPGMAATSRTCHHHSTDASTAAAGLQAIATRTNLTWPDVLIALIGAYVARRLERSDVVLGVATMNRLGTAAARVPATVMNVLPVRIPVDQDRSIDAFLTAASARLRKARRHGLYRSEQLRGDLGWHGGTRRLYGPVVSVRPFDLVPDLPGASSDLHVLGTGPVDDLTMTLRADPSAHALRITFEANPALYSDRDVAEHIRSLAAFFESAIGAPTVRAIPLR